MCVCIYIYTYIYIHYIYMCVYIYIYVCVCVCVCVCDGLPSGTDSKEASCHAGDLGLIPGSGRSPGEGSDDPSSIFT